MKKSLSLFLAIALIVVFGAFALASGENSTEDQGSGKNDLNSATDSNLGDYKVEIKGCRLAKDFEGKDVVIVKYGFTNNGDDSASFTFAFDDTVYQNGVGLNEAYILDKSANYDSGNQTKEIKKEATLDVEVAYELNDITTDIEVEVEELISFKDNVVKKKFSIK